MTRIALYGTGESMAEFLYKPGFEGSPMQVMATFFNRAEADEWLGWVMARGVPRPMDGLDRLGYEFHCWILSEEFFIEHRMRWGGTIAKD